MGLDFDALEYCRNVKDTPGPYYCPVKDKCDKSYKSIVGLQYHLLNYDHDNPQPATPLITPNRKKKGVRVLSHKTQIDLKSSPKEGVTFIENENMVQYDIEGKSVKVSVIEALPCVNEEEFSKILEHGTLVPIQDIKIEAPNLPEASYNEIDNYNICDAPPRPNAFIRFIEKSSEELDGEVEYDVDEEDTIWLSIMNETREKQGINPVSIDTLELLMDRLEKESFFQAAANGQSGVEVDDDAVCCICMDGECQNTNVILFCDMCNLAVHQDCYGVPYIPEGQWLCRRCLQSPSTPVSCVLCPNTCGAFKQTDRGTWAHVVCALWIPEVRFANTVFLEPIDSIEMIPPARWRLTCYVCKEKGIGACIQCQRNSCYAAFHVTCAQQAGLYMHMDTVKDHHNDSHVQKSAYCHSHTPPEAKLKMDKDQDETDTRHKMKEARKALAKKRSSAPVVLIPTIPQDRIQEISNLAPIQKKSHFIQKLIAYWTLKRHYRNGVPLLRRLQSQSHSGFSRNSMKVGSPNTSELYQQLKYWQCLRQDLERARLLCELVRKREKLKLAYIKINEEYMMLQLNPLESSMSKLLDMLEAKDTSEIFTEPVNTEEVTDYLDIVKEPMDFSTMREKLKSGKYHSLDDLEFDFDLMIKNCLAYNNKDTIFYRAGIRMRDQGGPLFKQIRSELEKEGLIELPKTDDCIAQEIDNELRDLLKKPEYTDEIIDKTKLLIDKSQAIKNASQRTKKVKQLRSEITKMKKSILKTKQAAKAVPATVCEDSQSEEEVTPNVNKLNLLPMVTPPCSPLKNISGSSASPSGVNRRTAVLFTRKAQAALKRPEITVKEESSCETPNLIEKIKSPKRNFKNKRLSNELPNNSPQKSPNKENFDAIPDSFRVYRGNVNGGNSELEDSDLSDNVSGNPCSSCSGFGISGSGSEFYSSSEDCCSDDSDQECEDNEDDESDIDVDTDISKVTKNNNIQSSRKVKTTLKDSTENLQQEDRNKPILEALQLVWAKCRGYPWYPALIIDPQTPRGFVYNGVALPAPPQDVLNLRKSDEEEVFLVLFFDAKRTWQWLPSNKLEILGVDKGLDQAKLVESRKPTERKAVKRAYEDALLYQSQVNDLEAQGPDPIM